MKENETRAVFVINKDTWQIYKLIVGRHRVYDREKGVSRQATASDKLREDILVFIDEQQDDIKALIAELKRYNPKSPLLKTLKEFKRDEKEE